MGQGRSVTQLWGYAVGTNLMTELNKATVLLFLAALSGFSDIFEFCFLFSSCTLLMKGIRTDKRFRFMFMIY